MKSWVKVYTQDNHSPDMQMLTWEQRGIWAALWTLAGEMDLADESGAPTGELDTVERTALRIHCDVDVLRQALAALIKHGMAAKRNGLIVLVGYAERQATPPSQTKEALRERQRKHRASVASAAAYPSQPVTSASPLVTSLSRPVTPPDTDTDSDTDTDPDTESDSDPEVEADRVLDDDDDDDVDEDPHTPPVSLAGQGPEGRDQEAGGEGQGSEGVSQPSGPIIRPPAPAPHPPAPLPPAPRPLAADPRLARIEALWGHLYGAPTAVARQELAARLEQHGAEVLLGALERVKLANVKRLDYLDAVLRQWGAPRPGPARASPGGGGRARRAPRSCSPYAQGLTAEEERRNRMVLEPFSKAAGERPDPSQNLTEPSSFPNNHGV